MSPPSSPQQTDSPPIAGEFGRTLTTTTGYVTAFSGLLASGLAVSGLLVLAVTVGSIIEAVGGLIVGGVLAISVALIGTGDIFGSIGGGVGVLLATGGATGLVIATVLSGTPTPVGLLIGGLLIGFGIARFRVDAFGDGAISRMIALLLRVGTVFALLGLIFVLLASDLRGLVSTVGTAELAALITPTTQSGYIIGFVLTAWLAFIGLWMVAVVCPPPATVPQSWQPQYETTIRQLKTNAAVILAVGSIVVAMIYFVSIDTNIGSTVVIPTLGGVVQSIPVRIAFLRLFFIGIATAVTIGIGRVLGVDILFGDTDWSMAGLELTGALFAAAVLAAGPVTESLSTVSIVPTEPITTLSTVIGPTATGLFMTMSAILALAIGFSVLPGLAGFNILPAETAGARLVVGGLLMAAAVSANHGSPPIAVVTAVAAGIIVWDLATFGSDLIADLGVSASHRETERRHAAASLGVGGLSVGGATLIVSLVRGYRVSGDGAVFAVLLIALVVVGGSVLFAFDTYAR